jgi:hypothetical protein
MPPLLELKHLRFDPMTGNVAESGMIAELFGINMIYSSLLKNSVHIESNAMRARIFERIASDINKNHPFGDMRRCESRLQRTGSAIYARPSLYFLRPDYS